MNGKNVFEGFVLGGLVGAVITIAVFAGAGGVRVDEAKMIKEEGKPALMRIYGPGRDRILVEDPEVKGDYARSNYTPLYRYLQTIEDPADRHLEEARIKKAVEWYK